MLTFLSNMTDHILSFWESQAQSHLTSASASWPDKYMVSLERDFIKSQLSSFAGSSVIDCGTSNGHSLVELAKAYPNMNFSGFDFSPEMVNQCNIAIENSSCQNISQAFVGDIRNIPCEDSSFEFSFTTRVLINLPTWDDQVKGIQELLRITKPGGSILIMEGFWEPLTKINCLRLTTGLEPLVEHDFNRYLKLSRLREYLSTLKIQYSIIDFSSTYYLMTRFIREAVGANLVDNSYTSEFNTISKDLHNRYPKTGAASGLGIQQAVIIRT